MRAQNKACIGDKFDRWTVLSAEKRTSDNKLAFVCRCQCGTEKLVRKAYLFNGQSRSCGCLKPELSAKNSTIHGGKGTREYRIWKAMKSRCYNENIKGYKNYGARGVFVCNRWLNSFSNFLEDMGSCPEGYSIDRIDVDGSYDPQNCRWASDLQQSRNKRGRTISQVCGVNRFRNNWRAQIAVNGRGKFLGDHDSLFDAVCARKSAELKYWEQQQ